MGDIKKNNRRFYAVQDIPLFIIEYLKSRGAEVYSAVEPVTQYDELFHIQQARSKRAILLTTNINYLSDEIIRSKKTSANICKIILRSQQDGDIPSSYGSILFSFINQIGLSGKRKITDITIEFGQNIKVHTPEGKITRIDVYKVRQQSENIYTFFEKSTHYNINRLKEMLAEKGIRKSTLTYDDIYKTLPDHIVSADLVDEIADFLKDRGMHVVEREKVKKENRNSQHAPVKIEEAEKELLNYERNVELELENLYAGYYEKDDNGKPVHKFQITQDFVRETKQKPEAVDIRIPSINIPYLSNVIPNLVGGDDSLLVLKVRSRKKSATFSVSQTPTEEHIDAWLGRAERSKLPQDAKIPKLYDKINFDSDRRLSLYARIAGRRAEEIIIKFLSETLTPEEKLSIKWISQMGETPGWDIEYINAHDQQVVIEVKGTTGIFFPNIEITGNEWNAACELKDRYWLYLVTSCFSTDPRIQRIQNPFRLRELGGLSVTPILWRMELTVQNSNLQND